MTTHPSPSAQRLTEISEKRASAVPCFDDMLIAIQALDAENKRLREAIAHDDFQVTELLSINLKAKMEDGYQGRKTIPIVEMTEWIDYCIQDYQERAVGKKIITSSLSQ